MVGNVRTTLGLVLVVVGGFTFGSRAVSSALPLSECDVSQVRHVARVGWVVVGNGPVSLGLVQTRRAEISIAQSVRDRQGWRGQKTPWFVPKTFRGYATVTARRIDGSGPGRFAFGFGQHLRKLVFGGSRLKRNPVGRFYFVPSATLFRRIGCYAFHVSGRGFSQRLVVRVVA
jgi:hypothetical protein